MAAEDWPDCDERYVVHGHHGDPAIGHIARRHFRCRLSVRAEQPLLPADCLACDVRRHTHELPAHVRVRFTGAGAKAACQCGWPLQPGHWKCARCGRA
jgi:hypothetical protein